MPKIIRNKKEAAKWFRTLRDRGATVLPGKPPVGVKGHCVGSVARAYTGAAAGYEDAHEVIDAVVRAGKLRRNTKAPYGAVMLWRGGKHGHMALATTFRRIWTVDLPTTNLIGCVPRRMVNDKWGYRFVGWCYAEDIPGWR